MMLLPRLVSLIVLLAALLPVQSRALDLSRKPQGGPELLSAEQAFRLVSATRDENGVRLNWDIAPGYYLYRQRMAVEPVEGGAALAALTLPPGTPKHDEHFGDVEIYTGAVEARLPVPRGSPVPAQVKLRWQGCAEAGVCYPPITRVVDVTATAP